jgi:hypothetical protein
VDGGGQDASVAERERADPDLLHRQAQVAVLSGLVRGDDVQDPEVPFQGRVEHRSSQYALYAAACTRGGLEPDLLRDAGWWQTPLWQYAVHAVVIYSRAAADRTGAAVPQVARLVAARHGLQLAAVD